MNCSKFIIFFFIFTSITQAEPEKELHSTSHNIFEEGVLPAFQSSCVSCHGDKKIKGKLRLDEYDLIMKGGTSGNTVVPGDPDSSELLKRILLPLDDEEHMPPKDKQQLTSAQIELIKAWIKNGALQNSSNSEKKPTPASPPSPHQQSPPKKTAEENKIDPYQLPEISEEEQQKNLQQRQKVANELAQVKIPGALTFIVAGFPDLSFCTGTEFQKIDDSSLTQLMPITPYLRKVDLFKAAITDQSAPILTTMLQVQSLNLSQTEIGDATIKALIPLQKLEVLNLNETKVTDRSIDPLAQIKGLKKLYLWKSGFTQQGSDQLGQRLPETEIFFAWDKDQPPESDSSPQKKRRTEK